MQCVAVGNMLALLVAGSVADLPAAAANFIAELADGLQADSEDARVTDTCGL